MTTIKDYIQLMRVHHYVKNFLVFAALGCSGQLFNEEKLIAALIGFISFCALSSVIYINNDIEDREKDLLHPTKCNRPIASGRISKKAAYGLALLLGIFVFLINWILFPPAALILLILYLILNYMYSKGLKNIPLIDLSILVSGFLIRLIYGSVITGIKISDWLYLTIIMLSFYFGLGKRRNELILGKNTRRVLQYYSLPFLDKNMYMCMSLTLCFYALWCIDSNTIFRYSGVKLIFTIPIVLLIMMKYSMDLEGDSDGDPVEVLLHDRILLILCIVYFLIMFITFYIL